jgi:hypothetical protein
MCTVFRQIAEHASSGRPFLKRGKPVPIIHAHGGASQFNHYPYGAAKDLNEHLDDIQLVLFAGPDDAR